jgi:hypothetical protein
LPSSTSFPGPRTPSSYLGLPGIDGYKKHLARRARENPETRAIRQVAITG